MARLPTVQHDDLPEDQRHVYDNIAQSRGGVVGPFTMLLYSPDLAGRIAHTGSYIRFETSLPQTVRILAALTVGRELDCQYEFTANTHAAREAGVREEAIAAIRDRAAPAGLAEEEALVVQFGQQLLRDHRVEETVFQAATQRFGVQGVTDLVATIGYYALIACTLNAFEVDVPAGQTPQLPIP